MSLTGTDKPETTWKRISAEMEKCLAREREIRDRACFINARILIAGINNGSDGTEDYTAETALGEQQPRPPETIFASLVNFFLKMKKIHQDTIDHLIPVHKEIE